MLLGDSWDNRSCCFFLFLLLEITGKGGDDRIFDSARENFQTWTLNFKSSSEFILKILCDRIEKFKKFELIKSKGKINSTTSKIAQLVF